VSDWPEGWYRGDPGQRGSQQAGGSGEQPTVANSGRSAWTQQPPTVASSGRSAWPAQPPPVSVPRPERHGLPSTSRPPGGRRWRFWGQPGRHGRRIALVAGLVVVVLAVALLGSYFYLNSKLNRPVTLPAFSGQSAGQNWLIAGADTRDGLTPRQIRRLHVGFRFGFNTSDSLMLVHIGGPRPVLLSIPRDSYVPIPGHGYNKINAALDFGGPSLLVQTVENVTGLRINHYLGIGFVGLVSVVNEVGGVRICLPTALHDANSGADFSAGCHIFDGVQALEFVRDRHSFADEDLQRIEDQRAFLKALLEKATSPSVFLNPFKALPFGTTAASSISVDKGTNLYDLLQVAMALRNPETGTVPVADANYLTANAGDALLWNRSEALELFAALQNDKPVPAGLLTGTTVG
jgi:LCP family protein required for cell wall assembly